MPLSGPILVEVLDDGVNLRGVVTATYTDAAGRKWYFSAGSITDGASIPRELWGLVGSPFTGKYRIPAFFHDEAYRTPGVVRDDADRMLREFAIECGCSPGLADLIYAGVREGGEFSYVGDQRAGLPSVTVSVDTQQVTTTTVVSRTGPAVPAPAAVVIAP